jgi:hypothetical protein
MNFATKVICIACIWYLLFSLNMAHAFYIIDSFSSYLNSKVCTSMTETYPLHAFLLSAYCLRLSHFKYEQPSLIDHYSFQSAVNISL